MNSHLNRTDQTGITLTAEDRGGFSEALVVAINDGTLTVVGRSRIVPSGPMYPFLMEIESWNKPLSYAKMLNLQDPHLCVVPTGWNVSNASRAMDVSTDGIVVGLGVLNGSYRGFAAVPQPVSED